MIMSVARKGSKSAAEVELDVGGAGFHAGTHDVGLNEHARVFVGERLVQQLHAPVHFLTLHGFSPLVEGCGTPSDH